MCVCAGESRYPDYLSLETRFNLWTFKVHFPVVKALNLKRGHVHYTTDACCGEGDCSMTGACAYDAMTFTSTAGRLGLSTFNEGDEADLGVRTEGFAKRIRQALTNCDGTYRRWNRMRVLGDPDPWPRQISILMCTPAKDRCIYLNANRQKLKKSLVVSVHRYFHDVCHSGS